MKPRIILMIAGFLAVSGCTNKRTCPGIDLSQSKTSGGEININLSVDASGSMKGYVNVPGSEFKRVLEILNSSLMINSALGSDKSTTTAWRIGREPPGKDRKLKINSLLVARKRNFYELNAEQGWTNVSSSLEQFVPKKPKQNSVDILISDLEPDNSAINTLIKVLKPRLDIGDQLTLVGIKSQFSGGVFPTTAGDFKSFTFSGVRPFYLIILGSPYRTERVVEDLMQNDSLKGKVQITRFATNAANGYTLFVDKNSTIYKPKGCMFPAFSLKVGMFSKFNVDNDAKWTLVKRLRGCTAKEVTLQFKTPQIDGFYPQSITDKNMLESSSNMKIDSVNLSSSGMNLQVSPQLPLGGLSSFQLSLNTTEDDTRRWKDWSTLSSNPEGGKTQRLMDLIRRLRRESDGGKSPGDKYSPLRVCGAIQN